MEPQPLPAPDCNSSIGNPDRVTEGAMGEASDAGTPNTGIAVDVLEFRMEPQPLPAPDCNSGIDNPGRVTETDGREPAVLPARIDRSSNGAGVPSQRPPVAAYVAGPVPSRQYDHAFPDGRSIPSIFGRAVADSVCHPGKVAGRSRSLSAHHPACGGRKSIRLVG